MKRDVAFSLEKKVIVAAENRRPVDRAVVTVALRARRTAFIRMNVVERLLLLTVIFDGV